MAIGKPDYVFGHSEVELKRLELQAAFHAPATEALLSVAGIGPGMRVLDVGAGVGDVSLLAARCVGPGGAVVGIDRSSDALAVARERASNASLTWCQFEEVDIDRFAPPQLFDAVVGRMVLMYSADPVSTMRTLLRHLKPGGVVAFQELNLSARNAYPDGSEFVRIGQQIIELFRRANITVDIGPALYATFIDAGLPPPRMTGTLMFVSDADPLGYDVFAGAVRSLLPQLESYGVATASELAVDTLVERLRAESREERRVHLAPPLIGAWSRKPR
jgi:SAM-dependent methyltransferase